MEKNPAKWTCPIGKFRGKSYEEIVQTDPLYASWLKTVIRNEKVKEWLETQLPTPPPPNSLGDTLLRFGKYKGCTYDDVIAKDVSYAKFLAGVEKDDMLRSYLVNKTNQTTCCAV